MKLVYILFCCSLLLITCEEKISGNYNENLPPSTTLFISSPDTLNSTKSIQTFYWDGKDPDGFVTGFYYAFGSSPLADDWQWTTLRKMTFPLQINRQDTSYIFNVKAVDNAGVEDPTPAVQTFPIKNSPPEISWQVNSNIPDTTFTVASFSWTASDLDGDLTISGFDYAIDDTTNWTTISGSRRSITLYETDGITAGEHAFFIRAVDVAGSYSPVIRMPEIPGNFWNVKQPAGRYLLIDDFPTESSISGFPDQYYSGMLTDVLAQTGDSYSKWNIVEQFPASNVQFTETLLLFDRIIWYTDIITISDPHFIAAQIALPEFLINGGKVVYTTRFNNSGFNNQGSPLSFSPVESFGDPYTVIPSGSDYYADTDFFNTFPDIQLPELKVNKLFVGTIGLFPKVSTVPMYRYDVSNSEADPLFIMLGKNEGKAENEEPYDFVFSGTPMHYLDGNNNLDSLFQIIFEDIF